MNCLCCNVARPPEGPQHPPIYWVPKSTFSRTKWSGREDGHSPKSNAEIKKGEVMLLLLIHVFLHGKVLS
jgi:hypothetical protein